jgi:hypothetical protein
MDGCYGRCASHADTDTDYCGEQCREQRQVCAILCE